MSFCLTNREVLQFFEWECLQCAKVFEHLFFQFALFGGGLEGQIWWRMRITGIGFQGIAILPCIQFSVSAFYFHLKMWAFIFLFLPSCLNLAFVLWINGHLFLWTRMPNYTLVYINFLVCDVLSLTESN